MANELLHQLKTLEIVLHRNLGQAQPTGLQHLLHEDFLEFGCSGRSYTKSGIIDSLSSETIETMPHTIWAQSFALKELAPDVALLTYKSARLSESGILERFTLRSSIWQRTEANWQMIFHQGTPTEPFAQEE